MPGFGALTPYVEGSFSLSFVDGSGEIARASLSGPFLNDTDGDDQDAWLAAVANASNAALLSSNLNVQTSISIGNAVPFDEAHSSTRTKAIFVFQNNERVIRRLEVPAPDMTLFASDGKTIDRTAPLSSAIITATLAMLNAGDPAGSYAYIRGGLGSRTRKGTLRNDAPTVDEPTALQQPPIAPGA